MPDKRLVTPNGRRIKELRQAAGFSLEQFAAHLKSSTGTLGLIERTNKPCFVATLHHIVDRLNQTKKVTTSYEALLLGVATDGDQPTQAPLTRSVFQLPSPLA